MKQKFLKNSLLLFLTGIIMVSCELQEEAIHQHEHNSNLKLYEMKFEELMTNKRFVTSFSKLPKSKKNLTTATVGRTVMENEYGFTIANKPAKVIENNGEISYTFLITRDSTDADSFENLVIQTDSTNTTKAVIMKYNLTSSITSSADDSYSFTYNREITPIVYNSSPVSESSKMIIICYWITTTYCNNTVTGEIGPEHIAGEKCRRTYTRSIYRCTAGDDGTVDNIPMGDGGSDGGGGGTATPDSNYNGSDTSIHGNGANNINTAPVAPEVEEIVEDPCEQLKAVTNDIPTKNKIFDLKPRTLGKQEFAIDIERKWDYDREIYVYNPIPTPPGSNFMTNVQVGGRTMGQAHNHPINGQSIPSWGDIRWTMLCEQNIWQINIGQAVNIIVVQNSQYPSNTPIIYAIKINDLAVLQQQIAQDLALPDIAAEPDLIAKIEKINAKFGLLNANVQNNTQGLERNFLGQFRNYGISLYKFDETNNNWNKLNLQNAYNPQNPDTQNPVISEPCN